MQNCHGKTFLSDRGVVVSAGAVESRIRALIGDAGLNGAYAPLEAARGLPNAAYTDPAWFDLELSTVFASNWLFAAAAAELTENGRLHPVELAGMSLLLVGDDDGVIRGFHNVCRHRGAALVDTPCTRSAIVCPYHRWSYGLDGSLRNRPHFLGPDRHDRVDGRGGPDVDLVPVRTATWNGWVFVNPSGDAPDLEEWLRPATDRVSQYDLSALRWIGKLTFDVAANWKLVYENYMEGYHVFSLHPRLLRHAPMKVRWSGEWRGRAFYNDYVAPTLTQGRGGMLPHFPGLDDIDSRRGLWFLRFPQFAAEVFADQLSVLATRPVAPDRTIEEIHLFVVGDEAATHRSFADLRSELTEMWRELNGEDIDVLERLQRGRRSPAYDGGRLSTAWEGPTHEFTRVLLEEMMGRSR